MKRFLFILVSIGAMASELDTETSKNEVTFLAVGQPSAIKIRGKLGSTANPLSGKIALSEDSAKGKVTLKLEALDTGIDLRNDHMKNKYLEVGTHPHAELDFLCKASKLEGKLTLHGKTQSVAGTCSASPEGKVNAKFKVKVQDFGIAVPSYLGITVADEVQIEATADGTPV